MRGRWPRQLWVYGVAGLFVVALGVLPGDLLAPAARTVVSLTFDNDTISQYTLGYKRALAPHGVNATFYVNSGTVGAGPNFMSWPQLRSLAAAGNEIGGKTVDGARLTGLTRRRRIAEICGDRERIEENGITPFAFAYPSGEFTAAIQTEVRGCGYRNARTAHSLSPSGPTYAGGLAPKNELALRAYAPDGQLTLPSLRSLVTGAAARGGGWIVIGVQKVCSPTADQASYAACVSSAGWISLRDLNTFLGWVKDAGQPAGAPAGTVFNTVGAALTSAAGGPPTTSITCNGANCSGARYPGPVTVALSAADGSGGGGVDTTYYTTDGAAPTSRSTLYSGPFTVTRSATVRFFSVDLAGNSEQPRSRRISIQPRATVVSLTFDDAYQDQWLYARPLLLSYHMNATLYVITSDSDKPYECCMSFAQLRTMQGEGNDIGGHGVSHLNLTDRAVTRGQKVADVCGSRADLIRKGIHDPVSYAYPFGAFNAAAERVVKQCGYRNSRQGGGISSSSTTPEPPWSETIPPKDRYALRTIAVAGSSPMRLSQLQNFVTAVASHGGGWLPITFHEVCNQQAADYSHCMSTYGPVQDTVLRSFMDWLRNAGRADGAPAGVVVQTVRAAMNSAGAAPSATIALCDGSPCRGTPYGSKVKVSLTVTGSSASAGSAGSPGSAGSAKAPGATIYYTTDGSTPTTSSPAYRAPLVLSKTATIRFVSTADAGHVYTAPIRVGF